jgi:MoaA/NifB/PqqE/SkfB family radical SAM enzyme
MCFAWKDLNTGEKELTLAETKRISSQFGKLLWLAIGGGEPFLKKELAEICEVFWKINAPETISIPTNCLLPDVIEKKTKKILDKCATRVTLGLSLDGIGELHDHIRGVPGNFKKFLETYERVSGLREKYPQFSVGILTTITELNVNQIPDLYDYVWNNLDVDFHTAEVMRGDPRYPVKPPSIAQYKAILPKMRSMLAKYDFGKGVKSRIVRAVKRKFLDICLEVMEKKKQVIPCYAGRINGVIGATGDVSFCELLPTIGNLRKSNYDFNKIWFSKKAEEQRKLISNKGCYCTHCIFQDTNILFNPWLYPGLLIKMV